jgi:hypothetical protein
VATLFIGSEVVLPVEFSVGSHTNLYHECNLRNLLSIIPVTKTSLPSS